MQVQPSGGPATARQVSGTEDCEALVNAMTDSWFSCPPYFHGSRCSVQFLVVGQHMPADFIDRWRCRAAFANFQRKLTGALLDQLPAPTVTKTFQLDGNWQPLTIGKALLALISGMYWSSTIGAVLQLPDTSAWRWAAHIPADLCPSRPPSFYCLFDWRNIADFPKPDSPKITAIAARSRDSSLFNHTFQATLVASFAPLLTASPALLTLYNRSVVVVPRNQKFGGACSESAPSVSVHVRRGDSCESGEVSVSEGPRDGWTKSGWLKRPCYAWPIYSYMLGQLLDSYGICRVYLASDATEVFDEATQDQKFEWHYIRTDRSSLKVDVTPGSKINTNQWIEFRQSTAQEGLSGAMDAELLSRGDMIVGSFASHYTRLSFYRIMGKLGFIPPFFAVDGYTPIAHLDYPSDVVSLMGKNHKWDLRHYICRVSGMCCNADRLFPGHGFFPK